MTEEQTANAQVVDDTASIQQADDTAKTQTSPETIESNQSNTKNPESSSVQVATQPKSPEPSATTATQIKALPEEPQFVIGAIFFTWIFCTLVFLSITAGYVATH